MQSLSPKKKKNRLEKQEDDGKACDVGVSDPIHDSDRATESEV